VKQLNAYLRFDGNCREAMTFYMKCLGGELKMQTVGESPMAAQSPNMKDKIMHSVLTMEGITIMASDMMGPEGVKKGNTISLSRQNSVGFALMPNYATPVMLPL
jgi:PhnB protein